jgi:hypothetical protein
MCLFLYDTDSQMATELDCVRAFLGKVKNDVAAAPLDHSSKRDRAALADAALARHLLCRGRSGADGCFDEAKQLALCVTTSAFLGDFYDDVLGQIAFESLLAPTPTSAFEWNVAGGNMMHARALHLLSLHAATKHEMVRSHDKLVAAVAKKGGFDILAERVALLALFAFGFDEAMKLKRHGEDPHRAAAVRTLAQQAAQTSLTSFGVFARWSAHWRWARCGLIHMFVCLKVVPACPSIKLEFEETSSAATAEEALEAGEKA